MRWIFIFSRENRIRRYLQGGIWVRDSSAGIGTMTYYDRSVSALQGWPRRVRCRYRQADPLSSGEIVDVNITGSNAGQSGKPGSSGQLQQQRRTAWTFEGKQRNGVVWQAADPWLDCTPIRWPTNRKSSRGRPKSDSTISGNKPQEFDIIIEKVNYSEAFDTKNMVIRVVDERLLAATGGIVQGMSGSRSFKTGNW
jgi:stage IV sporulation protein B